jgi:Lrp/AsnC family transcriptional regulator for asnA, asnC and gidA
VVPPTKDRSVKLRSLDLEIIRCVQADPRSSFARIASELGAPESTVRHRLNRLVQSGIVEFATMTNPLRLGYQIWAMIEVQTEMSKVESVAQRVAAAPEVTFVAITTGSYDILVAAVFRSNEELLEFVTGRLSRIPGISRTTTSSVLKLVKRTLSVRLPPVAALDGNARRQLPPRRRR